MADKNKKGNLRKEETIQSLSYELQTLKSDIINELKVSSIQIVSMYEGVKNASATSASAIAQEIRYAYKQNQNIYEGVAKLLKTEVAEKIISMSDQISAMELETVLAQISDLKYSYMQLQSVYEGLSAIVSGEMLHHVNALMEKSEMLDTMQKTLEEVSAKLASGAGLPEETIKAIVEESISVHSKEILDAVTENPVGDSVDYTRIGEVVGDKILTLLGALKVESAAIDYEKVAGDTAAKVVESLPYTEPVDYNRINDMIVAAVSAAVNVDAIANAVAAKMPAPAAPVDMDAIADMVVAKMTASVVVEEEKDNIDYDKLADLVVEKLAAKGISADLILDQEGVDKIADAVAEKVGTVDNIDYDKVCLAAQSAQIVPDSVDYDRVAEIVESKLNNSCDTLERVVMLNDEGIQKIVDGVAEELRTMTLVCEYEEIAEEEPVVEEVVEEEPVAEEVVEEPVVEEVVEEPVVEEVEEPAVEEVVEEVEETVEEPATEAADEIASAADEPIYEEGLDGELIDAETGLVIRLKRSFIAKMKQSDDKVKAYYSDLKNELTSYKKINSNVSWHGDRFNFGRDTVAKIGINGKTLCFYLALDPNDPELKQTVYHQKDVGNQKAYESTPFMVKTKSDAALKKALRLVAILAEKLGTEKDEKFEAVDYTVEFSYESTKSLFEAGYIKATKEKKVDFNF